MPSQSWKSHSLALPGVFDMAKPDIWMPLYIGDYLADTMHLTTEQHGAYLLLIMAYWKNGGAIPSDDRKLMAICRLGSDAWSMHKHTLASFFDLDSDPELWIHVRAEKEMEKAGNNQEKRTLRAQKAAEARWGKHAPSNAPGNAPSIPKAMLNECPSPSPSHIDPSLRSGSVAPKKNRPELVTLDQLVEMGCDPDHARDWLQVRKKKKSDLTPTAWKGVEREAAKAGISVAMAVQISAERGWIGFKSDWDWGSNDRQTNGQRSGASRPSLVDRVREANAHLFIDEPPPVDERDWPEFDSLREIDGTLVGPDD